MKQQERRDHYQEVTDRMVEALEQERKPWVRPWDPDACGGPQAPLNPTTGRRYRGVNVLILGMDMRAFETGDPRWCTYQQASEAGWQVRKGEKSTTIFLFKPLQVEGKEKDGDTQEDGPGQRMIAMMRSYAVFHASQLDGIPPYKAPTFDEAPWTRPDAANVILTNSRAVVRIGGDRAFYSPSTDHIQLPPEHAFNGAPQWAATALHELGHWTGHPTRLNRDLQNRFGSAAYAMEELRAELASAFVGAELGLPTDIPQHASYIASWIKVLKNDKREIFRASADAQKIADMQLSFHPDYALSLEPEDEPKPLDLVAPASSWPRPVDRPDARLTA